MMLAVRIGALAIAALHTWFLVLEMFLWTTPFGRRTFGLDEAFAKQSAALAKNQGLYNGFLVAGLVWGAVTAARPTLIFFLACVVIAGVYGGITVNKRIAFIQALPAAIVLALALCATCA
jgi:putative membrane protein